MSRTIRPRPSPLTLTPARLRWLLLALCLVLVIPTAVLVLQAQQQIKWEALYQHRTLAEEFSQRVDERLQQWIAQEEARNPADYEFLLPNSTQLSTLAQWPVPSTMPGLIGYFQVDEQGQFRTPLLPATAAESRRYQQPVPDANERETASRRLQEVLGANRLVEKPRTDRLNAVTLADKEVTPAPSVSAADSTNNDYSADAETSSYGMTSNALPYAQQNFDRLKESNTRQQKALGRIDELQLEKQFSDAKMKEEKKFRATAPSKSDAMKGEPELAFNKRKEMPAAAAGLEASGFQASEFGAPGVDDTAQSSIPAAPASEPKPAPAIPVRLFESEVDPFEFALLDSGHLVLFRKVWQNGGRRIQGLLLDQNAFFDGLLQASFQPTALAQMSDLILAFQGDVLRVIEGDGPRTNSRMLTSARDIRGTLLLQQKLSAPLGDLQLIFSLNQLPDGPGARVVTWTSAVLGTLLLAVFYALYRLGLRQIRLTRQQQDFVSAVSHELKTPLTSIRMFSEMLKEGWVGEEKRREYYQFISDESERLSRLIANVLQLARMERNEVPLDVRPQPVATILDLIRSRVTSQVDRSGFQVQFDCAADCAQWHVLADNDALVQIVLNLVDNAAKFADKAERHQIDIALAPQDSGLALSVRDYGPGIPAAQTQRIFDLFYRVGSELTRETQGTGIGLALVRQLARAMGGDVSVINREPGAEFRVWLKRAQA
ncbi:MAG TPA: HAMP domain-containing sensor histidine kinase [Dongiaceae bacterium]|nr:HAMP domain-containing sensor histidine kinase [Dongiaceae bacterium]